MSATEKFKDYRKPTVYGVGYIGSKIKIHVCLYHNGRTFQMLAIRWHN